MVRGENWLDILDISWLYLSGIGTPLVVGLGSSFKGGERVATEFATQKGKEFALQALRQRREKNAKKKKIDNASLPAGSPMYFYCISCAGLADTKPEGYITPPKKLCGECRALKDLGWLEE